MEEHFWDPRTNFALWRPVLASPYNAPGTDPPRHCQQSQHGSVPQSTPVFPIVLAYTGEDKPPCRCAIPALPSRFFP